MLLRWMGCLVEPNLPTEPRRMNSFESDANGNALDFVLDQAANLARCSPAPCCNTSSVQPPVASWVFIPSPKDSSCPSSFRFTTRSSGCVQLLRRVQAGADPQRDHRGRRLQHGRHTRPSARTGCRGDPTSAFFCQSRNQGKGGGAARGLSAMPRARWSSFRTPTWSTTRPSTRG